MRMTVSFWFLFFSPCELYVSRLMMWVKKVRQFARFFDKPDIQIFDKFVSQSVYLMQLFQKWHNCRESQVSFRLQASNQSHYRVTTRLSCLRHAMQAWSKVAATCAFVCDTATFYHKLSLCRASEILLDWLQLRPRATGVFTKPFIVVDVLLSVVTISREAVPEQSERGQ